MNIFIENKHLYPVNPVDCGEEYCMPSHSYGPAVRNYYLLHYVCEGYGVFIKNKISYHIKPGQIFVINPDESTYYIADQSSPWHYIWVGFTSSILMPEIIESNAYIDDTKNFKEIFTAMLSSNSLSNGREEFICGKLCELLSYLYNYSMQEPEVPLVIRQAINYIQTSYMNNLSIIEIADLLHLNRCYFSSLFKRYIGASPQQYLNDYRLKQAALLIKAYGYKPGEAAASTGYSDICNFSRMFKRKYGISPEKYGKMH